MGRDLCTPTIYSNIYITIKSFITEYVDGREAAVRRRLHNAIDLKPRIELWIVVIQFGY